MVNYPTILGLPQEDIDRQLYVGVLGLESRVKALENKPKPILEITVTDGTNPVSGATVTIGTDEETSDSEGVVEFELAYGDYSATIEASGYTTATESLAFRSNHKNFSVTLTASPSGDTGTVTVTCIVADDEIAQVDYAALYTGEMPTEQDNSNLVAVGSNMDGNVVTLYNYDTTTHQTTDDPNILFGTYNIYVVGIDSNALEYEYTGTLTVDGDEEVTITLIPIEEGD